MYRFVRGPLAAGLVIGVGFLSVLCAGPGAADAALAPPGGTSAPLGPPPASIAPPQLSGTAQQGQALVETHGVWSNDPTSYTYQWQRCTRAGGLCRPIKGATLPSYTLSTADVGHRVRVEEWAYNSDGSSAPEASQPTARVRSIVALALKDLVLSGVSNKRPALRLLAVVGTGGSPLKSVTVLLPAGVSVSHGGAHPAAISIVGTYGLLRSTVVESGHQIRVTCLSRTFGIRLHLAGPVLALSPALVAAVRTHALRALPATLVVSDTGGGKARFPVTVAVS